MTYQEAIQILRDAVAPRDGRDLVARLVASPGKLSLIDASTCGKLPEGDSYGDDILRSLMIVWRHVAEHRLVERELLGALVLLDIPVRTLAADLRHADTRIPQKRSRLHHSSSTICVIVGRRCICISTALKWICQKREIVLVGLLDSVWQMVADLYWKS